MMQAAVKIPVYNDITRKIRIEKPEPPRAPEPESARPDVFSAFFLTLSYLCSLTALFLIFTK